MGYLESGKVNCSLFYSDADDDCLQSLHTVYGMNDIIVEDLKITTTAINNDKTQ